MLRVKKSDTVEMWERKSDPDYGTGWGIQSVTRQNKEGDRNIAIAFFVSRLSFLAKS